MSKTAGIFDMPTEVEARSQPDPRRRPPHAPSHIPVDLLQEEAIDGGPNGSRVGTSYFAPSQLVGAAPGHFELAADGLECCRCMGTLSRRTATALR